MSDERPTCGLCGKEMTPENSTIRPEMFVCDDCTLTPADKAAAEEARRILAIKPRYLGDGVYARLENGMIKLTTENGFEATNTIFLELAVVIQLHSYIEDVIGKLQ